TAPESSSAHADVPMSGTTLPLCGVGPVLSEVMENTILSPEGIVTQEARPGAEPSLEEELTHKGCGDKLSEGTPEPRLVQNYASMLKASAQLEEIGTPSEHISGAPFVLIPDENIEAAKEEFKDFIFARFHGDCPSMGRIIGVINAIWAKAGPRIFVHNIGDAGYPMFVAAWSPDFTPEEAPISSAIVPVELRNVPYLLFNRQSLSRLATAIGKPESLAPETERKENFQVAKLYVRVDLTKELPTKIISGFSSGRECEISVTYPWLPVKCSSCRKYGHSAEKCRFGVNTESGARVRERSVSPGRENKKDLSRSGRRRAKKSSIPIPPDHEAKGGANITGVGESEVEDGEIVVNNDHPHDLDVAQEPINTVLVGKEDKYAQADKAQITGNSPAGGTVPEN
ncbi:unnamed protein product, partial [Brassica rapa]